MFDSLGSELGAVKFFIAFAVVIGLIALTAWLVRRFGSSRLAGNTRGRQPRLAVVDAAAVDGRRRLLIIRRDNVEHLLMIGGPTDVVVEQNIVRGVARGERGAAEPAQRGVSLEGPSPSLQPGNEPSIAPARGYRNDEDNNWQAPEPVRDVAPAREPAPAPAPPVAPRIRPNSLTGMAVDLSAKMSAPDAGSSFGRASAPPPPAPAETFGRPAPMPEQPRRDADADNLAEMASRLEAALRRPPEPRPPVTDPLAVAPVSQPRNRATEIRPVEPRKPEPRLSEPQASEPRASEFRIPEPRISERAPEPRSAEPRLTETRLPETRLPETRAADFQLPESPKVAEKAAEPAFAPEVKTSDMFSPPPPPPQLNAGPEAKAASNSIYDSLEQEMASLLGRPASKQ